MKVIRQSWFRGIAGEPNPSVSIMRYSPTSVGAPRVVEHFEMVMNIEVIGKNIDVSEALRRYAVERAETAVDKYVGGGIAGHIRIEKEGNRFKTHCSISLRSGLSLQSHGEAADAYASADAAFERLEKRVRRYKRKLRNHNHQAKPPPIGSPPGEVVASDDVLQHDQEMPVDDGEEDSPVVIAENRTVPGELTVAEAVMTMDLADEPVLVFRNAGNGRVNVVYQRRDGNIGWIDPQDGDPVGGSS